VRCRGGIKRRGSNASERGLASESTQDKPKKKGSTNKKRNPSKIADRTKEIKN